MTLNQFLKTNLDVIRDEIITNIQNPNFDSHEFIRGFAKKFEIEYIEYLSSYKLEPFRNVHAQIGKFLVENQINLNIVANGTTHSSNIFGIESPNELWSKS